MAVDVAACACVQALDSATHPHCAKDKYIVLVTTPVCTNHFHATRTV